jgi:hypothetical protein
VIAVLKSGGRISYDRVQKIPVSHSGFITDTYVFTRQLVGMVASAPVDNVLTLNEENKPVWPKDIAGPYIPN